MRLFALTAAVFASALSLATFSPAAHAAAKQGEVNKGSSVVKVQQGDSLDGIAKAKGTTYQRLFYANTKIKDPDLIYPGDKLRVPTKSEKLKERPIPSDAPPVAPAPAAQAAPVRAAYNPAPATVASAPSGGVWDQLAACESGGNWAINTGNGFYGGLQFTLSSWQAVGGSGYPHQASKSEQIARAQMLQARQGWGAWPACSAKLGLL